MMTNYTAKIALQSRFGIVSFLIGKFFRFGFFIFFLVILMSKVKTFAGYIFWEVLLMYATLNFIDTATQLLFREVYRFRTYVVKGFFDYILVKPMSPLFRSLLGGSDVYDTPVLLMSVGLVIYAGAHVGYVGVAQVLWYILLLINACFIVLAVHIFVLSVGITTTAVDNAIMMYRDTIQMGRVPISIYANPLRFFITFVIPVGIMVTYPVNAFIGSLSLNYLLIAFCVGAVFFCCSLATWNHALKQYASASS